MCNEYVNLFEYFFYYCIRAKNKKDNKTTKGRNVKKLIRKTKSKDADNEH